MQLLLPLAHAGVPRAEHLVGGVGAGAGHLDVGHGAGAPVRELIHDRVKPFEVLYCLSM